MIDTIDRELERWVENVLGAGLVSFALPDPTATGSGVSLYLLDLGHRPPARGAPQPHLDLTLRYLVTSWGPDPAENHKRLADLMFAAASTADYEIEPGSPPLELWMALRVPPRPAFVLRAPMRRPLPVRRAPLVRRPISLEISPAGALMGQCVGPGEVPLSGALIELPALNVATRTDHDGRFVFASVPRDSPHLMVRATAKGKTVTVEAGARPPDAEPLVIAFDMTEG